MSLSLRVNPCDFRVSVLLPAWSRGNIDEAQGNHFLRGGFSGQLGFFVRSGTGNDQGSDGALGGQVSQVLGAGDGLNKQGGPFGQAARS